MYVPMYLSLLVIAQNNETGIVLKRLSVIYYYFITCVDYFNSVWTLIIYSYDYVLRRLNSI